MADVTKPLNPWSSLTQDDLDAFTAAGNQALQSGKISPQEAMKNYQQVHPVLKSLGITGQGPLMGGAKKSAAKAPAVVNMPAPGTDGAVFQKAALPPVAKGSGLSMENENTAKNETDTRANDKNSITEQRINMMGSPQYEQAYSMAANSPAVQEQMKGIKDMKGMLAMEATAPSDIYSRPIASLLQTEFGRNTSNMEAGGGSTPEQKRQRLLAGLEKAQDDQRDVSKTIADYIAKQKAGTSTIQQVTDLVNAAKNTTGAKAVETAVDPNKFIHAGGQPKPYNVDAGVEKLQKKQAGLENLIQAYQSLDKLVGGFDNYKGQDLPGIGLTGYLPSSILSSQGAANKEAVNQLKNTVAHELFGSRLTATEIARLNAAMGTGLTGSDRDFILAMKRMGPEIQASMAQNEAAFKGNHPEVLSTYAKGGGRLSDTVIPKIAPAGPKGKAPKDMTDAELDAYLATHGGK